MRLGSDNAVDAVKRVDQRLGDVGVYLINVVNEIGAGDDRNRGVDRRKSLPVKAEAERVTPGEHHDDKKREGSLPATTRCGRNQCDQRAARALPIVADLYLGGRQELIVQIRRWCRLEIRGGGYVEVHEGPVRVRSAGIWVSLAGYMKNTIGMTDIPRIHATVVTVLGTAP